MKSNLSSVTEVRDDRVRTGIQLCEIQYHTLICHTTVSPWLFSALWNPLDGMSRHRSRWAFQLLASESKLLPADWWRWKPTSAQEQTMQSLGDPGALVLDERGKTHSYTEHKQEDIWWMTWDLVSPPKNAGTWLAGQECVLSSQIWVSNTWLMVPDTSFLSHSLPLLSFASVEGYVSEELHSYPGWKCGLHLPPPQSVSHSAA